MSPFGRALEPGTPADAVIATGRPAMTAGRTTDGR